MLKISGHLTEHDGLNSDMRPVATPDAVESNDADKHLFADVIEQWLRYSKLNMDENTHGKYSYACIRIVPYFRELGVYVEDLLPDHFTEYYLKQVEGNPEKGLKPLSPATLSAHHTVLRSAVRYSINSLRIIETKNNPIATVSAPKKGRRMPSFYTDKQLNRTFETIRGLPIEPCVIIAANYGFRRGEVLGLKWDAVNFEPTSKNPHEP